MHTCFIAPGYDAGAVAPLSGDEARHALRVMRLRDGDEVRVTDGQGGLFRAILEENDSAGARVRLLARLPDPEAPVRLTLYQGYPKSDKLELIAQKLTELGVFRVVPVLMERSVAHPDGGDMEKKRDRLQKIAAEAAKQSGRARVPEIAKTVSFQGALSSLSGYDAILLPWEKARGARVRDAYANNPNAKNIAYIVGPEGGIAEREIDALTDVGAACVTLGPRILRTETAALACAAMIMSLWGDL